MEEELIETSKRINQCFVCVRGITSSYELIGFEEYLKEQKKKKPITQIPIYLNREYVKLQSISQRIELLKKMIAMETI